MEVQIICEITFVLCRSDIGTQLITSILKDWCVFYVTAFKIGQGAVAGGAVLGLGALCYYGLGLSSERGAVDYAS